MPEEDTGQDHGLDFGPKLPVLDCRWDPLNVSWPPDNKPEKQFLDKPTPNLGSARLWSLFGLIRNRSRVYGTCHAHMTDGILYATVEGYRDEDSFWGLTTYGPAVTSISLEFKTVKGEGVCTLLDKSLCKTVPLSSVDAVGVVVAILVTPDTIGNVAKADFLFKISSGQITFNSSSTMTIGYTNTTTVQGTVAPPGGSASATKSIGITAGVSITGGTTSTGAESVDANGDLSQTLVTYKQARDGNFYPL